MKYKETNKTIPEIGKELNVAHVLEGSVRKFGNRIRVTAQLIITDDDFHLWSEHYDKEYRELFDIQDEVSEAIAYSLNPKSSEVIFIKMLVSYAEQGIDIYDEIRFKNFMEYLKINPNQAFTNLQVGLFLRDYGLVHQSLLYYNKAVELNPLFTWNYSCRGRAYFRIGEYERAELDYKKALEIEPHDYANVGGYIHYLIAFRRIRETEELIGQWQDKKPNDNTLQQLLSWLYALKGDKENALSSFNKTTFEKKYDVSFTLAVLYLLLNDQEKAIELIIEGEKEYSSSTIFYNRPVGISRSRYFRYINLPYYKILHNDPSFQEIMAKHKELYEELLAKYGDINI